MDVFCRAQWQSSRSPELDARGVSHVGCVGPPVVIGP